VSTVVTDPLIGRLIDGRYEVGARLARGGMATVYRALDRRLDREVAVKVMHPHLAESEDFVTRFRREARAAARLSHPHVVAVHDQGLWQDSFYLTMEFVDGEDLRAVLRREGPLPLGRALAVTQAILDALAVAHRRGLVHRDVKPENVMLTRDGVVKVADFGLARAVSEATVASTGTLLGTVAYLAPELVTHGQASPASDVYATGILLHELLTGHQPFTSDIPINVAFQHVHSTVPPPSEELPWLPREVDDLLAAMTARDPAERLENGDAALARLRQVLAGLPEGLLERRAAASPAEIADGDTTTLDDRPSHGTVALPVGEVVTEEDVPPSRSRAPRVIVAVIALALALGAGWWFLLGPGSQVAVPPVVGLQEERAVEILSDAGLAVDVERANDDVVPAGEVVSSEPAAGEPVRRGGEVTVLVSEGILMLEVPTTVGLTREAASADLQTAGFPEPVVTEQYHQEVPAGVVISSSAAAGEVLPHLATIELTVSLGREPVDAADVTGLPLADARGALEGAGLVVATAEEYSNDVPEGAVITQDPPPGQLYRGDTVTVTVSLGRPFATVPSVFGLSRAAAIDTLESAGFVVKVESLWGGSLGMVRFQDPAGGQQARLGSTVTITVV